MVFQSILRRSTATWMIQPGVVHWRNRQLAGCQVPDSPEYRGHRRDRDNKGKVWSPGSHTALRNRWRPPGVCGDHCKVCGCTNRGLQSNINPICADDMPDSRIAGGGESRRHHSGSLSCGVARPLFRPWCPPAPRGTDTNRHAISLTIDPADFGLRNLESIAQQLVYVGTGSAFCLP